MIGVFCYAVNPRKISINKEKNGLFSLTFYARSSTTNAIRIDMSKKKLLEFLEEMEKKSKSLGLK